jgi:signal transduction histidine kinase
MCGAGGLPSRQDEASLAAKSGHCVTNVAQFQTLSGADFLDGCDFCLTGIVTLVDTKRNLVVLQDRTGAVALNFRIETERLKVGQRVTLDGTHCCPLFPGFPDYPYRPSGQEILSAFETPTNWGEYNLTRMRGYLHPQATGNYRFWIASDDSSELWLSTGPDPAGARKIAFVPPFGWVKPHEWSKYPSQQSEPIQLKAGETYYLEALQEQTIAGENLSVAWQASLARSNIAVIEGRYLTPWNEFPSATEAATNGVLREYWTNYFASKVVGLAGVRPYVSALTVKQVLVTHQGWGELPKPVRIALNQPLTADNSYRWVQDKGLVKFAGTEGDVAVFEIFDGQTLIQVCVLQGNQEKSRQLSQMTNAVIQVEGVCEGVENRQGIMMPGRIWAAGENGTTFLETGATNEFTSAGNQPAPTTGTRNPAIQGYFGTQGEVTFNDHVLGKDYIFVQQDNSAFLIRIGNQALKDRLKVGQYLDLGGAIEPGEYVQTISPILVVELGWHPLPAPIILPSGVPVQANQEGRWSEFEGVVHRVNSNGTLSVMTEAGPVYFWLGETPTNHLSPYVDAKLRARGVPMQGILDAPVLLIPSRDFVEVEEASPEDPFGIPSRSIAGLLSEGVETSWGHRVRVVGEITYSDAQTFFVQDSSGGIRVRAPGQPTARVGETIEALAFPTLIGSAHVLAEALVRPAKPAEQVKPKDLDLSKALSSKQGGTLVQVSATLLARNTNGMNQVLELQEKQRIFVAILATSRGNLPEMFPGSRLQITGVCDDEIPASPAAGEKSTRAQFLSSLTILLRGPQDVKLLSGPPWWTWKKTALLVGVLLTILAVVLLWVQLLQRRLERQQAAQLAFSRQVLGRLEEERRRIAVNLHDSLGQTLLVIKNHAILATQSPADGQGIRNRLEEISGTTSQAIEEVRRITHGLRPYQLDRLGLTQAIRASVNQAAGNGPIVFASRVEDIDGLFEKDAEIHVYRIVQEAVTNVVKHSGATEATVVIKKRATSVSLSIRDNGRGFEPAKPSSEPHDHGYGLTGIAERARILGGTLAIESRPGEGASLTVEVPFPILKI